MITGLRVKATQLQGLTAFPFATRREERESLGFFLPRKDDFNQKSQLGD